jgi:diguanylate cyclase (GGDEF)-like protein
MPNKIPESKPTYLASLSDLERKTMDEKVNFELELTNYYTLTKMASLGGLTNILAGAFIIWVLYGQIPLRTLLNWYGILVVVNLVNIFWSTFFKYRYKEIQPDILNNWRSGLYFIFASLCLTWGSIGVFFIPANPYYQFFVISYLQLVVLGCSFGSIIDFSAALISISCLLLPTIIYHFYKATQDGSLLGYDNALNIGVGVSLLIFGAFLLAVCYLGYVLTKNKFTFSALNSVLNEKLETMNNLLEVRVKDRTLELENSLKLVSYQATHDLLTDLPNQRSLIHYMDEAIKSVANNKHMLAIILFSLNEIDKIEEGLGYQAGETVIRMVAERFKNTFSNQNFQDLNYTITLSRKDIFVILLDPIDMMEELERKITPLFSVLNDPVNAADQTVKLTASIGVSVYPRHGKNINSLLMNAESSMFQARQKGGNFISIYKDDPGTDMSKQLEVEKNLHDALPNNEFELLYQPIIDLKTGFICGAEALVRWRSPSLGYVMPSNFIPIAEMTGIINPLGAWVFEQACKQLKEWHTIGFRTLHMAINLSAKQLLRKNLSSTINTTLLKIGLTPEFIQLELTESVAFQSDVVPILNKFKQLGLGLSIDDFGTGYSGLSSLKLFSIDILKIDKSFIHDLNTNNDNKTIVSNTIALAKKLNLKVVAEGVETIEQLAFLKEGHCDMIQGYYYSPPIAADDFIQLLKSMNPLKF